MTTLTLPVDLRELTARVRHGEHFSYRFFWGHTPRADGALSDAVFSQWWTGSPFEHEGQRYATAEQFMMAGKARLFGDGETLGRILATDEPGACKALGRQVRGFDEGRWAAARLELVTAGNLAKFGSSPALREHLLATGDTILVEASPHDTIWGIGLPADHPHAAEPQHWKGQNLLGFALMAARARLA